jgi:hypothetical protein
MGAKMLFSRQPPVISDQPSAISCQWSAVRIRLLPDEDGG